MTIDSDFPRFRALYEAILAAGCDALFERVLQPWMEQAREAVAQMELFRQPGRFDMRSEQFLLPNWNLYALSRVNDLLLMPFQDDARGCWDGPRITLDQYGHFFTGIGFRTFNANRFSPFYHEIVAVEQSPDQDQPIAIEQTLWPGLMLGDLLFSRSGVRIVAGSSHALKSVAEQSPLYFAYRRLHRRTVDLSQGWGSNSQWRTLFRRDYVAGDRLIYNIDGTTSLDATGPTHLDEAGLTAAQRLELCRHRCFVVTDNNDPDLWPFADRYEEPGGDISLQQ